MDKYMKEVINEDKLARKRVEEAKKKLAGITSSLVSEKSIYDEFMKEEEKKTLAIQQKLEIEIETVKKQCEEEKAKGLELLKKQFITNKDQWIENIIQNILS